MDKTDTERLYFMTPTLTPHVSDSSVSDYFDLECSFSHNDYQQHLLDTATDLQRVVHLCRQLDDNESESDIHDQQPTEASDDDNGSAQRQATIVTFINDSLHPQSPHGSDDNPLTVVQEIDSVGEIFSSATSDTETLLIAEEDFKRPILTYSRSLCVPYPDEEEGTTVIKETLTTTSEVSLEFTGIDKKAKNKLRHIMISYNHSTKEICSKISKYLKNHNYIIWIDQDNISGDILTSMALAVENAFVVLMAINEQYYNSCYCRLEAEYSVEQNKALIPMLMQTGYKPHGWLGIIKGAKLHIDFSQLPFDEAFNLLVREIENIRTSLEMDLNAQTVAIPVDSQITTTVNNSWYHLQNVHEWSADDVIEWINREKLDIFENTLGHFTGATLWQLYKIKFDSPSDYHRMVDTLLPSTTLLRLFYILTFNAAIESLFSSSMQRRH